MFQHTTARRRLPQARKKLKQNGIVSTHNRPKAAAVYYAPNMEEVAVSTHNRPKAAASLNEKANVKISLFQHTTARRRLHLWLQPVQRTTSFNTQPPEGGCEMQ